MGGGAECSAGVTSGVDVVLKIIKFSCLQRVRRRARMSVCVHCLDMRVVDVSVADLDSEVEKEVQEVVRVSFDRRRDVNLSLFHSVVMVQERVDVRTFLGFQAKKWKPVGVMLVKSENVNGDFPDAKMCVNLTCVCVSNILRGQGIGTSMMKWYLETLPVGTVVYLHVDKVAMSVEVKKVSDEDQKWRDFVLSEVDQSEYGQEMGRPEYTATAEISSTLVDWYKTLGFEVHYENCLEVCMFQYVHKDAMGYDSEDWKSSTSSYREDYYEDETMSNAGDEIMFYHEDVTDI